MGIVGGGMGKCGGDVEKCVEVWGRVRGNVGRGVSKRW